MTTLFDREVECGICGKTCEITVLGSSNQWGYADLDLRPPEMYRSTMDTWMDECPNCGFVSPMLKNELGVTREFIESETYKNCEGHEFISPLAKRFYRAYMIYEDKGLDMEAFSNLLHCVWACDDRDDSELAVELRVKLADMVDKLDKNDDLNLMKADFLRRSRQFERVIEEYENVYFGKDILNQIVRFQIEKSRMGDDKCYTVEDVIK